jgi:hypothetical protein
MPISKDTPQLAGAKNDYRDATKRRQEAQATLRSVSRKDPSNYDRALRNLRNATADEESAGRAVEALKRNPGRR